MFKINHIKTVNIILTLVLFVSAFNGCAAHKISTDMDEVKNNVESYLIQNGYKTEVFSSDKNAFSVQAEKGKRVINMEYIIVREDHHKCTITVDNSIDDYTEKYTGIDYKEIFELSEITGIEKITDDLIKKACEDKRDVYDSSNDDYSLASNKIMSKIYRVGFFENPVIMYELSSDTETVTILWNS